MKRLPNLVVSLHAMHKIRAVLRRLVLLRVELMLDKGITHKYESPCDLLAGGLGRIIGALNVFNTELADLLHVLNLFVVLVEVLFKFRPTVVHYRCEQCFKLVLFSVFIIVVITGRFKRHAAALVCLLLLLLVLLSISRFLLVGPVQIRAN